MGALGGEFAFVVFAEAVKAAVPEAKPGMPGAGYVRTATVDWPANLQ